MPRGTPSGAGDAWRMARVDLGETKGPLIVWVALTAYASLVTTLVRFGELTPVSAVLGVGVFYGFSAAFLVGFVSIHEGRRLADVFAALGLRKDGIVRSLEWGVLVLPLVVVVGLGGTILLASVLGPLPPGFTRTGPQPAWLLWFTLAESFFPVAVVEEMYGRGYLLDRLLPGHPCTVRRAVPALLLSAALFALWHLASYLEAYAFSLAWTVGLIALNAFPLGIVLGIAYVRSRTQNIAGMILLHFLLDALPVAAALVAH